MLTMNVKGGWRDAAVRIGRASGLLLVLLAAARPEPAEACGGAFFPAQSETVAVRGHQMAVSISKKQTVVWDRIEVDGNPSELAWVIPVHEGATLELSSESWFTALSKNTEASLTTAGSDSTSSSGGCGCGGASYDTVGAGEGSVGGKGGVTVLERTNVGPYDAAKLRAKDPGSIRTWLLGNGFKIPDEIGPVLDQYTSEGFDFIALRVRPGAAAAGLQPLRLTTPGADPTLPLRMSRAGVKTSAALTLFVLAEGRYRVQGFEEVGVDRGSLAFNGNGSNYDGVVEAQLTTGDGRRFVVEHAKNDPDGLAAAVFAASGSCIPSASPPSLGSGTDAGTSTDAGVDAAPEDAGDLDAGEDPDAGDGGIADAAPDGETLPPPKEPPPAEVRTCATTDLAVARDGLSGALWVTRLRAKLPASAFAQDLRFEANPSQDAVGSDYVVSASGGAMIAPSRPSHGGTVALFGLTVLGLVGMLKRRRRAE
jgi:hypothetical protein